MQLDTTQSITLNPSQERFCNSLVEISTIEKSVDFLQNILQEKLELELYVEAEIYRQMITFIVVSSK